MPDIPPDLDWLRRPPIEGEEAQRLKERSQANRRAQLRSKRQMD